MIIITTVAIILTGCTLLILEPCQVAADDVNSGVDVVTSLDIAIPILQNMLSLIYNRYEVQVTKLYTWWFIDLPSVNGLCCLIGLISVDV